MLWRWQIVQSNGDPIPRGLDFICEKTLHGNEDTNHVFVLVDQEASIQLLQSQSPQLEFVLLQQWTYNETSHTPQILRLEDFDHLDGDYAIPTSNPTFVDHVWLMAIAPQGDGIYNVYERLAVTCMPARFWEEADPEAVSVDIV